MKELTQILCEEKKGGDRQNNRGEVIGDGFRSFIVGTVLTVQKWEEK